MDLMWTPQDAEVVEDVRVVIFTISAWYNKSHVILPNSVWQYWDLSKIGEGVVYQVLVDDSAFAQDFDIAVYDHATVELRGSEVSFWSEEGPYFFEEEF